MIKIPKYSKELDEKLNHFVAGEEEYSKYVEEIIKKFKNERFLKLWNLIKTATESLTSNYIERMEIFLDSMEIFPDSNNGIKSLAISRHIGNSVCIDWSDGEYGSSIYLELGKEDTNILFYKFITNSIFY